MLRTVGGVDDRVPHVNEQKVRRRMRENEMPVAAIEPGLFEAPLGPAKTWLNEIAIGKEAFAFCNRIDCPLVVTSAFAVGDGLPDMSAVAEALRRAGETAAEFGVRLAVRNRRETTCVTGRSLAQLLTAVDHPAVGAAWNPVEAKRGGEAPLEGIGALEGRVDMLICPDVAITGELAPGVQLEQQLGMLSDSGFNGPVCLEVVTEPKPKVGLRAATQVIRMMQRL